MFQISDFVKLSMDIRDPVGTNITNSKRNLLAMASNLVTSKRNLLAIASTSYLVFFTRDHFSTFTCCGRPDPGHRAAVSEVLN